MTLPFRRYDVARTTLPGERRPLEEWRGLWVQDMPPHRTTGRRIKDMLWYAAGVAIAFVGFFYLQAIVAALVRGGSSGHLFVPEGCGVEADTERKAPVAWVKAHSPKPKETAAPKAKAA